MGCAAQGGDLEPVCQVRRDMDGAGRSCWSRRGLRETGEGSLGNAGCERKGFAGWWIPCGDLGQLGGLMGGCWWRWVCTVLALALPPAPHSSDSPLPTPVFPDTKPYEVAEPFGAPPGKVGAAGPGAPWDKGKSSEVSVMLTVSAAAAKVSEGMGRFKTLEVPALTQHSDTCGTLDPSCLPLT